MSRSGWRRALAVLLTALMVLAEGLPALAEAGRGPGIGTTIRIEAKSRKKKKATPTPAAQATPGAQATPEEETEAETVPETEAAMTPTPVPDGPIIDPQSIADYLFAHGKLPDNFITKRQAQELGWDNAFNYVSDVAPGKSIGGDRFWNREGRLPVQQGRTYYEADCWYTGGKRNGTRVIYSNDGRVWYTEDHYETFTELFPTVP